jgi:hypothetical protein
MHPLNPQQMANLKDFPIESKWWPGWFYLGPRDLDEMGNPLLVNPLNTDASRAPELYLRFGVRGILTAIQGSGRHKNDPRSTT